MRFFRLIIRDVGYYWLVFLAFILGRYFLVAGGAFWLFCSKSKLPFLTQTISQSRQWRLIRQDIALSVLSAFLFALLAALIMSAYNAGGTRLYSSIGEYGWGYLGFSFCAILLLQDTYFYFTHRLLHHPRFFKSIHQGHHRSRVPTPWTSFAFELSEALIHGIFFVGLVWLMPLHFVTLIAVFTTMTLWAIATHLGFELVPPNGPLPWLQQGLIGPIHHGIHHRQHQVHFGLYFTFWDRVFGTTDPAYLEKYAVKKGQ
ncbi:MAG: sterol desaturase family protein [Leptolyngbyaceae cyanobacterium SM1_1_3]|nr:sterol desaturase family protein [Leptolyngbyaceae cyanobacterium SM1_1_3]NJM85542.1 sterol desaturase family protein [Leptolyngbyaceae cyanobacterium RM2_2_21]NJN03810.1 sterol desaturase family protein [Leptolyngbyaceae cyanobacterium RM1_1_2]NJO08651.1 sterol desaturase family protein [Leptolyngbyaceae cyanobacterium SL_1_1]